MQDALSTGKGVSIRNLLSISSVRTSIRDPSPGLKNHVFFLAESLCRSYGVSYRKPGLGLLTPTLEVNTSKICVITGLDKDAVVGGLKAMIAKLGEYMGSSDHVKIPFGALGTLLCDKRVASFKFGSSVSPGMIVSRATGAADESGDSLNNWVAEFTRKKKEEGEEAAADAAAAAVSSARAASAREALETIITSRKPTPTNPNQVPSPAPSARATTTKPSSADIPSLESRARGKVSLRENPVPYDTLKKNFEEVMSSHPFPKFLIPDTRKKTRDESMAVTQNMKHAYARLEGEIVHRQEQKVRMEKGIEEAKERGFKDYCMRRDKESRLRAEMTQCLDVQSAFDRERKTQLLESEKNSVVNIDDDFRAYPMAKALNLAAEYSHKKFLREGLEMQCAKKIEEEKSKKASDLVRERKRLESLHNDLRRERIEALNKKYDSQGDVAEHWEKQIDISRRLREV
jgi:hypothetical protein